MKKVSFVHNHEGFYNIMFVWEYTKDNLDIVLYTHVEGSTCYGATVIRTASSRNEAASIIKELRREYKW